MGHMTLAIALLLARREPGCLDMGTHLSAVGREAV